MENFAEFVNKERERLGTERDRVLGQIAELDGKRLGIDRELEAIDAYDDAKNGRAARPAQRMRQQRTRKGSRREALLDLIRQSGKKGLKRGELLERMGLKGDKSGEMSVSNALTALTKRNEVERQEGRYVAAGR